MPRLIPVLAASLGIAAALAAYAAQPGKENDALTAQATITITQAIATAEQQHPGSRAARAELEASRQHGLVYDVELVDAAKVLDVQVDARTGVVVATSDDKIDHDDDQDERD